MPLAPGLFSTMKFWPNRCCSRSATSRAIVSGVAPAANGTMIRTALAGQSCALAGAAAHRANSANAKYLASIFISPPETPHDGGLILINNGFLAHMFAGAPQGQASDP